MWSSVPFRSCWPPLPCYCSGVPDYASQIPEHSLHCLVAPYELCRLLIYKIIRNFFYSILKGQTSAHFTSGCGTYSDWKKTNKYQRLNNNCSIVYQRTCDFSGGSCYGPPNKVEQTDVSKCSGIVC